MGRRPLEEKGRGGGGGGGEGEAREEEEEQAEEEKEEDGGSSKTPQNPMRSHVVCPRPPGSLHRVVCSSWSWGSCVWRSTGPGQQVQVPRKTWDIVSFWRSGAAA
eukprot:5970760-Pyramimonas_sp.AAC.1